MNSNRLFVKLIDIVRNLLISIVLFFLISNIACNRPPIKTIRSLTFQKGVQINVFQNADKFFQNNLVQMSVNTLSFRRICDTDYVVGLCQDGRSVLLFNQISKLTKQIEIPSKQTLPISLLYFHNPDSIFLFIERDFVVLSRSNNQYFSDFLLIDGTGNLINQYSLDLVPNIYFNKLSETIFLTREAISHNIICKKKMYLPFFIYEEAIGMKSSSFPLLCEFNLETEQINMLNINIPQKDIGHEFFGIPNKFLSFRIHKEYSLLYSFNYSSDIYTFDIVQNKTTSIQNTILNFNNIRDAQSPKSWTEFDIPIYCFKDKVYLRTITFKNNSNVKSFRIQQILDSNLCVLGYQIPNKEFFNIFEFDGNLVYNSENCIDSIYQLKIIGVKEVDLKDFEKIAFENMSQTNLERNIKIKGTFKYRFGCYLKEFKLDEGSKIVCINIDQLCASTFNYIISSLSSKSEFMRKQKLKILFYSTDINSLRKFLKPYSSMEEFFIIDEKSVFTKYIFAKEFNKTPMLEMGKADFTFFEIYNCDSYDKVFNKLMISK